MVWDLAVQTVPVARLGWSRAPRDGAGGGGMLWSTEAAMPRGAQKAQDKARTCLWMVKAQASRAGGGDSLQICASLTQRRGRVFPGVETSVTHPAGSASLAPAHRDGSPSGALGTPVLANPVACLRLAGLQTKPVVCAALDSAPE